jgi:hypothetical protein
MSFSDKILDFNLKHRVASHLIFWLILLAIQLIASDHYNHSKVPFINNLIGDGANLLAQIPAAYVLVYFIVPRFVYKQRYIEAFICFLLTAYVICMLSRIEVVHVEEPYFGVKKNPRETYWEILTDIPKLTYVYFFRIFSVSFVFTFLKLLKDQLLSQKHALSLEKEKAETELKMLKTQLNPHFLFNTLNNIYSLSLGQSAATSPSIARLGDILDYILYRCDQTFVPLSGEVALLNNYIELEKLRYDERLHISFKTSIDREVNIAPLIMLSLAENAFKHGAGDDAGTPEIDIDLEVTESLFSFRITNTVASTKYTGNGLANGGIGLNNLRHQLQLIYGDDFTLETVRLANSFTVTLTIQLKAKTTHEKYPVLIG